MIAVRRFRTSILGLILIGTIGLISASPSFAAGPWWHVTQVAQPENLAQGANSGKLVVFATNTGDGDVNTETTPVTIADKLPSGLEAVAVEGSGFWPGVGQKNHWFARKRA